MRTCDRPESCRLLAPENERTTQQTGSNTSEIGFAQPRGIESRNVPSTVRLFCFASVSGTLAVRLFCFASLSGTLADACRPPIPACPATARCCRSRGRAGVRSGPRVASRMDDQRASRGPSPSRRGARNHAEAVARERRLGAPVVVPGRVRPDFSGAPALRLAERSCRWSRPPSTRARVGRDHHPRAPSAAAVCSRIVATIISQSSR